MSPDPLLNRVVFNKSKNPPCHECCTGRNCFVILAKCSPCQRMRHGLTMLETSSFRLTPYGCELFPEGQTCTTLKHSLATGENRSKSNSHTAKLSAMSLTCF